MSVAKIKVLHLIGGDLNGGAALGAYSLHRGLLANGVYSNVLTNSTITLDDATVHTISEGMKGKMVRALRAGLEKAPPKLYYNRKSMIYSSGFVGYDFTKSEAYAEATIINLHWINNGFVSMRDLRDIKKPIVWTLRDMWPMTGGCHYAMDCENYTNNCGKCPQLGSSTNTDLSRIVIFSKTRNIPKATTIVGISHWLSDCARASSLFKEFDVRTIANNIDTAQFFPIKKTVARNLLGIDTRKKIILIGAQSLNDFYKGFDKFLIAIKNLDREKYHICFFGHIKLSFVETIGFDFNIFGFLHDTISLRIIYSAADVFVAPSIMDAFGKTIAESMACGTPVVCFDATGPKDIVEHKVNGYLATPFDPVDLAKGINWVANHLNIEEISHHAREKVVRNFDYRIIADKYTDLYREILDSQIE
jgi:glycosyltransferase involved in cell wall biosynthesis